MAKTLQYLNSQTKADTWTKVLSDLPDVEQLVLEELNIKFNSIIVIGEIYGYLDGMHWDNRWILSWCCIDGEGDEIYSKRISITNSFLPSAITSIITIAEFKETLCLTD